VVPDGTPTDTAADVILPVDGACSTGLTICSGACVDLTKDPANCGKCGSTCPSGATCTLTSTGTPACTCPAGQVICGSKCADLSTDITNCGGCGTNCGISGTCVSGKCVCSSGATLCGTLCTDTTKDPLNCSGCGKRCPSFGACTVGSCSCPAGTAICTTGGFGGGTVCADTNADPGHCGTTGCGARCGDRDYCDGTGKCVCRPGLTACTFGGGTTCLNTNSSPNACGACGTTCTTTQICVSGKCEAAGTACPTGTTSCVAGGGPGGTLRGCYDLSKDPTECGTCGNACAYNELCVAGTCRAYTPAPTCTTCPCADCGTFFGGPGGVTCCPKLPGQKSPICVRGGACPA
jgi:hypothetical protein